MVVTRCLGAAVVAAGVDSVIRVMTPDAHEVEDPETFAGHGNLLDHMDHCNGRGHPLCPIDQAAPGLTDEGF